MRRNTSIYTWIQAYGKAHDMDLPEEERIMANIQNENMMDNIRNIGI